MKNETLLLLLLVFFSLSRKQAHGQFLKEPNPFADENIDDLGDVSDEFQTQFFEALKQKGIENHERAITALNRCVALQPDKAVLYFERGKNQAALKQYDLAERDYLKSLELKPDDQDVLELLYDVNFKQRDYEEAEGVIKKLIIFNSQYKEDLAKLYTATKRYDEALDLIEELDVEKGSDIYRDQMKNRLYMLSGNTDRQVKEIKKSIATSPKSESEYLKLIFLYSEQGEVQKAYDTALELQKINPEADEVHLALYKFYLDDGKTPEAIASMLRVIESKSMEPQLKHRVLNDFLNFVSDNPSFEPQLEKAIIAFDTQVANSNIYQSLAQYYIKKGSKTKALPYLTRALDDDPEDLELIKNTALLQLDSGAYKEAEELTSSALDLYPSQPLLYLTYGVSLVKQSKFKQAIDQLETGVDYIIDDTKMESDFYQQLGNAYTGIGDGSKASSYYNLAKKIKTQID